MSITVVMQRARLNETVAFEQGAKDGNCGLSAAVWKNRGLEVPAQENRWLTIVMTVIWGNPLP